jgi:hypothetical protein
LLDSACAAGKQCRNRTCVDALSCSSSLDCTGQTTALVCDTSRGVCEDCVSDEDCGKNGECIRHVCSYYVSCTSSLDCPQGQVCDTVRGRCAECAAAFDCGSGQTCYEGSCTTRCISDKDCLVDGQLCDKAVNACVDCLQHVHCPLSFHCKNGTCEIDVCEGREQACSGQTILECTEVGDSMQSIGACAGQTTCVAIDGDAQCAPWVCTAGQPYCQGDHVIGCSADGLEILTDRDCASEGMKCFAGECRAWLCQPGQLFCHEGDVKLCGADGLSYALWWDCWDGEYCDAATATCKDQICTPDTPACDGTIATTCNAEGSGYVSGGTNCANNSTTCSMGTCVDCADGRQAASGAKLVYVHPSENEAYVSNLGPCTIGSGSLYVRNSHQSSSTGTADTSHDTVYSVAYPEEATYTLSLAMSSTSTSSNLLLLCYQDCSATENIIDVVQLGTGISPPAGITFAGPLPMFDYGFYYRIAAAGSYPSFAGSDWGYYSY